MSGLRGWEREHLIREKMRTRSSHHDAGQSRAFLAAGMLAAVLVSVMVVRSVIGLGTSQKPTSLRHYEIPRFDELVACDAHYSHEILRIKNNLPAHNTKHDLARLHRDYRRLHRLLRQVGRRDGIAASAQSAQLRARVKLLNQESGTKGAAIRDARCRAMANMPIARSRKSQLIVGQ